MSCTHSATPYLGTVLRGTLPPYCLPYTPTLLVIVSIIYFAYFRSSTGPRHLSRNTNSVQPSSNLDQRYSVVLQLKYSVLGKWHQRRICGEEISVFAIHLKLFLAPMTDLVSVIPYKEPLAEKSDEIASTMATTLPMVAVRLAWPLSLTWLTREDVHKK